MKVSFNFFIFIGFLIPACLMVSTSYVGCEGTSLAVVLFSLALGVSNLNAASFNVNHLDIAPRYAGVLMGITNSAGTIPGIIGPFVVGVLTDNKVCLIFLHLLMKGTQVRGLLPATHMPPLAFVKRVSL